MMEPLPILVYGESGVGKTMTVARAFPGALWVVTDDDNLRSFDSWCRWNWAEATKLSHTRVQLKAGVEAPDPINPAHWEKRTGKGAMSVASLYRFKDGRELRAKDTLLALVSQVEKAAKAGNSPNVVVFDEISEFGEWIRRGAPSGWGGWDEVRDLIKDIVLRLRSVGVAPVFIAHESPPKFDQGKITLLGGPALPIQNQRAELSRIFSFVLRLLVAESGGDMMQTDITQQKKGRRLIQTDVADGFFAKIRDANPNINLYETRDIPEILRLSGC